MLIDFEEYALYASIQNEVQEQKLGEKKDEETTKQKTRLMEISTHQTVRNALRCESMCPCPMFCFLEFIQAAKNKCQQKTKNRRFCNHNENFLCFFSKH